MKFLILIVVLVAILFQCIVDCQDTYKEMINFDKELKEPGVRHYCKSGNHLCEGSMGFCPDGYECTGTDKCEENRYTDYFWIILGPVLLLAIAGSYVVCYKGCRDRPHKTDVRTDVQPKLVFQQDSYSQQSIDFEKD
ncbi:uncharacterized protein [Mytilus edulis]|uniref:uncharacterized protein isoform X2 n=1 Tax=Mytilus edulis TaxID=6550 RepID=UPI0039F0D580